MKYYLYISPLKIQMLYEQLPVQLRNKLSGELSIDLKLIGTTIKKDIEKTTQDSMLNAVVDSLDERLLGSVSKPGPYFRGSANMRWAPIRFTTNLEDEANRPQLVLFAGSISCGEKNERLVGLIGSLAFVMGSGSREPATWWYTNPFSVAEVAAALRESSENEDKASMFEFGPTIRGLARGDEGMPDVPQQKLEFVAKRFLSTEDILLGSPLYVALVE